MVVLTTIRLTYTDKPKDYRKNTQLSRTQ